MSIDLGIPAAPSWANVLRRFTTKPVVVERCEVCSLELPEEHEHLVVPATRKLLCACGSCAVLFGYQANSKYRRVPRRIEAIADFGLAESTWTSWGIPINLAFFFRNSAAQRVVAMYPSPGGATESLLDMSSWDEFAGDVATLREIEDDVEALLVNRVGGSCQAYRIPIDECYKLVGLIRTHWRGFSGGTEVWTQIEQFFTSLDERATRARSRSKQEIS